MHVLTMIWRADLAFFVSSRRRHTGWPRDWSSDVCSSDLWGDHGRSSQRCHPPARASLGGSAMITPVTLAALLQRFFTQRLMRQRQASPHTISSYRDSFRQFLKFVQQRLRKPPSRLTFEEIDAPLIVAFLDELEKHQGVSVRSRNLRLTAIHSSFNTRLSRHPPILHRSSACSPSPASASPVPWSSSSL